MIEKLKQIYNDKIILNVTKFDHSKYYYFYNTNGDVFGIEKTININEYKLISSAYIEKKIYDNDNTLQPVYEYLFENSTYPFKNNKAKLLIIDSIYPEFKEILLSFFKEVELIKLDNIYVAFCFEAYSSDINNFLITIIDDLGINFKLHEGININSAIPGKVVLEYLSIIKQYITKTLESYTDISNILTNEKLDSKQEYINIIDQYVIGPVLKNTTNKDIILTYFKNDLNVSKTAKDLYINRNSLLNKFEAIHKLTGLNLQKFTHACAMYLFISHKE
ncbi:MAG: helix-turn-helix domain-containing protein [Bacilli bacterium]|nr:helix-turn-helix domain-containing protein [Bacilli bacterium]